MIGTLMLCASLMAVDGDTIKCDGVNLRDMGDGAPNVSGYDTPEISRPQCDYERDLGREATIRMGELLRTPGLQIIDSGKRDRYQRPLVWALLADGRSIGNVLIAEGLAVEWRPGRDISWCR
jgi:micrococcal nuclease